MVKNGFIDGLWSGLKVEFGRVYSNPLINAFKQISEADSSKKLRVFDFDDTLVKTNSFIYVKHGDGKESKLTPGEYQYMNQRKLINLIFQILKKFSNHKKLKVLQNY